MRRKELLKRASRGLVDDAIIDKPKKGFFHEGLGAWLQPATATTLVRETLLDGPALGARHVRPLRRCLDLVERAEATTTRRRASGCSRCWRSSAGMLMFVDGRRPRRPSPRPICAPPPSRHADTRILILVQNEPLPRTGTSGTSAARSPRRLRRDRRVPAGATRHQEPYERLQGVDIHRYRPRRPTAASSLAALEYASALWSMGGSPGAWPSSARSTSCTRAARRTSCCWPCSAAPRGARFIFDHHDLTPELFRVALRPPGPRF